MREIKFAVDALAEDSYALLERLTDFMAVLVSFASRNKMNLASILVSMLVLVFFCNLINVLLLNKYLAACIAPTLKFTPAIFTYCIQYHAFFFSQNAAQIPYGML